MHFIHWAAFSDAFYIQGNIVRCILLSWVTLSDALNVTLVVIEWEYAITYLKYFFRS